MAYPASLLELARTAYQDEAVEAVQFQPGLQSTLVVIEADVNALSDEVLADIEAWSAAHDDTDLSFVDVDGSSVNLEDLFEPEEDPPLDPEDGGIQPAGHTLEVGYAVAHTIEIGAVSVELPPFPDKADPATLAGARALTTWLFAQRAYLLNKKGDAEDDEDLVAMAEDLAAGGMAAARYMPPEGTEKSRSYDFYENAMMEAIKAEAGKQTESIADWLNEQVGKLGSASTYRRWIAAPTIGTTPSPRWYALHIAQYMIASGNPDATKRGLGEDLAELAAEMVVQPAWMDKTKDNDQGGILVLCNWLGTEVPKGAKSTQKFIANVGKTAGYKPPSWWAITKETVKDLEKATRPPGGRALWAGLAGLAVAIGAGAYVASQAK